MSDKEEWFKSYKLLEAFINTHTKQIKAIEENIDYAKFEIQEQRIEALEKKVDGLKTYYYNRVDNWYDTRIAELKEAGSARQTEKKGVCFMGDCVHLDPNDEDPCKDDEAQRGVWGKCREFKAKASGGENSRDSSMEGGESIHIASPNDSKLPELCKHDFSIKGDFIICNLCGYIAHERPNREAEPEKESEFLLIEKFIPPRNVKCSDCMANPVPELIEEFLGDIKWLNMGLDPYPSGSLYKLKEKWEGRLKK